MHGGVRWTVVAECVGAILKGISIISEKVVTAQPMSALVIKVAPAI
jgi:hypothetical protein